MCGRQIWWARVLAWASWVVMSAGRGRLHFSQIRGAGVSFCRGADGDGLLLLAVAAGGDVSLVVVGLDDWVCCPPNTTFRNLCPGVRPSEPVALAVLVAVVDGSVD